VFGGDEQFAVVLDDELLPHVPVDVHASTVAVSRPPYIGAMPYFCVCAALRSGGVVRQDRKAALGQSRSTGRSALCAVARVAKAVGSCDDGAFSVPGSVRTMRPLAARATRSRVAGSFDSFCDWSCPGPSGHRRRPDTRSRSCTNVELRDDIASVRVRPRLRSTRLDRLALLRCNPGESLAPPVHLRVGAGDRSEQYMNASSRGAERSPPW
jgi:hypothetical protein